MGQTVDEGFRSFGFEIPILHAELRGVHHVDEIIGRRESLGNPGDNVAGGIAGRRAAGFDQDAVDRIRFLERSAGVIQPRGHAVIGQVRPGIQLVDPAGLRIEVDRRTLEGLQREIQIRGVAPHILEFARRALIGGQGGEAQSHFVGDENPVDIHIGALGAVRVEAKFEAITVSIEASRLLGGVEPAAHRAQTEEQGVGPAGLGHGLGVEIVDLDATGEKIIGQRTGAKAAHGERRAGARGDGFRIGGIAFVRLGAGKKFKGFLIVHSADIPHEFLREDRNRVGQIADLGFQLRARQGLRGVVAFVGLGADDKGIQHEGCLLRGRGRIGRGGSRRSDRLGECGAGEERQGQGEARIFHGLKGCRAWRLTVVSMIGTVHKCGMLACFAAREHPIFGGWRPRRGNERPGI